jgi:hypothetical protein
VPAGRTGLDARIHDASWESVVLAN